VLPRLVPYQINPIISGGTMKIEKKIIQELGQLTVLDNNNNATPLASLWEKQKTVLIFVRHFG
jgi:hypothetical protein